MQRILIIAILLALGIIGLLVFSNAPPSPETTQNNQNGQTATTTNNTPNNTQEEPDVVVVAEGLEIPWDIAFLPDGSILATERPGRVVHIESGTAYPISGVVHTGEGGLLGIALHPDFSENHFVYLYQTTNVGGELENRITRYVYENGELTLDRTIFSGMPGAPYHDGGRIEFGPDGMLYVAIGDATNADEAQNTDSLAGSILRLRPDGSTPEGNPFGNAVYSYGHRNPQGLAWDNAGRLWSTEHGRSGVLSGMDEVNFIEAGRNYGWPEIEGDQTESGMVPPKAHSGPNVTWAPASAAYLDGRVFFGGLRGEALYEATLNETEVTEVRAHLKNEFGRIRTVRLGADGYLYLTTSNRDGRGDPREGDDKIIRVNPDAL